MCAPSHRHSHKFYNQLDKWIFKWLLYFVSGCQISYGHKRHIPYTFYYFVLTQVLHFVAQACLGLAVQSDRLPAWAVPLCADLCHHPALESIFSCTEIAGFSYIISAYFFVSQSFVYESVFKNIVSRGAGWHSALQNVWIWLKEIEILMASILSLHFVNMYWIITLYCI